MHRPRTRKGLFLDHVRVLVLFRLTSQLAHNSQRPRTQTMMSTRDPRRDPSQPATPPGTGAAASSAAPAPSQGVRLAGVRSEEHSFLVLIRLLDVRAARRARRGSDRVVRGCTITDDILHSPSTSFSTNRSTAIPIGPDARIAHAIHTTRALASSRAPDLVERGPMTPGPRAPGGTMRPRDDAFDSADDASNPAAVREPVGRALVALAVGE